MVLLEPSGEVNTAFPLSGPGVVRNPDAADVGALTVADLAAGGVSYHAEVLLDRLADRLTDAEIGEYRALHHAGEWEELADVLAAHLSQDEIALSADEHDEFARLLGSFEIPMPGYAFINNRESVLRSVSP